MSFTVLAKKMVVGNVSGRIGPGSEIEFSDQTTSSRFINLLTQAIEVSLRLLESHWYLSLLQYFFHTMSLYSAVVNGVASVRDVHV